MLKLLDGAKLEVFYLHLWHFNAAYYKTINSFNETMLNVKVFLHYGLTYLSVLKCIKFYVTQIFLYGLLTFIWVTLDALY